jgi:putative peptide zinc metalloprotease protein
MLAVVSMGAVFFNLIWSVVKIIRMPRSEPMSRVKIGVSLSVLGLLIAAGLLIPFPWFTQSVFVIEPVGVHHVYTQTAGVLEEIAVAPGSVIDEADTLAVLTNPELEDKVRQYANDLAAASIMPAVYEKIRDAASQAQAEEEVIRLRRELAEAEKQKAHLLIQAPVAGVIVEPPRRPEPTLQRLAERLPTWYGTPLEKKNIGSALDEGTHLCSIAPVDTFRAVLLIDQADRDDITVGQEVRLKLDHMPYVKLTGKIQNISDRHQEFAPPALSNKYGGSLPTVTDSEGREKLSGTIVYEALVELDQDPQLLKSGMRGQARFIVAERSAAQWLWRLFRRTFHFRL